MLQSLRDVVEVGLAAVQLIQQVVEDADPVHDRAIRFEVEMISDALAVRKIAGVIMAERVSYWDGAAIGIGANLLCDDFLSRRNGQTLIGSEAPGNPRPSTPPGLPEAVSMQAAG